MMEEKIYTCECGRTFTKANSFNGHKSHCKIHLEKTGRLHIREKVDQQNPEKISKILTERNNHIRRSYKLQWVSEKHTCEKCGKVMTEQFGSGRFCSRSCANGRSHSEQTKEKLKNKSKIIVQENTYINANKLASIQRYKENPKYCFVCGCVLPYENRYRKTCLNCNPTRIRSDIAEKQYNASPKHCAWCNKELPFAHRDRTYCSNDCYKQSMSKQRKDKFLRGEITYSNVRLNYKYGTYKGISCDSSWELAYIMYLFDHNIKFERNRTVSFEYTFNNEFHRFFPDFIVGDTFVEIKSRESAETAAKVTCIPQNISFKIFYEQDISPYINYAVSKYGKDFTKLYDRNYPSWMDKIDI